MKTKNAGGKKVKQAARKRSLIERLTGLTLSETFRLRHLTKNLAGEGKTDRKQLSTQNTITYNKMFKDGLCQVTSNYYTMMIEYEDINYSSLDDEEKMDVLDVYSGLINSFDPDIHVQMFFFNRKIPERRNMFDFGIIHRDDGFEEIRDEFSDIITGMYKNVNKGIVKSRYLIFGIEAESRSSARDRFKGIIKDVRSSLLNLGSESRLLEGSERLELLHEFFNQDCEEPFHFSFEELAESGNSTKDYISPQGFDFRYPGKYMMGHVYCETKYLNIDCPKLKDDLLDKILSVEGNVSLSIHMQTLEAADAIKLIKRSMSEIQTSKINQQKKAFRDGYDMDILSADLLVNEKSTMELLENLNSSNQKLVWTTPIVSIFGKTKREIATLRQEMNSVTREANISMTDLQYLQEKAMNAAAPIGINETGSGRHLTTKNLAVLIPFKTKELCQGGQALYYGKNKLSGNLILADRKNLRTPNGMILGTPGSGKSLEAKLEVLETFLKTNDDIIICDPEGEYHPLVYALGGEVIKLSTSSTDYLNPMDIQVSSRDDREELKLKSDFIITLCDHIAGGKYGLANDEKGIIDRCIERIYEKFFEDPVPEKMPILEDLYNALINYEPEIAVTEELAIDAKKKAVRIANSLILYVHGSQNYFNHRSTVDSTNRILCFDIRDLSNQLKELGMLIVQDAVWNRVSANRDRNISTRYYCDEFHLLLREKQTAVYAVEIWKRFRKWGGIPTGLTQNVSDFLRSSEIEGILGNSDFIILLHQSSKDQDILLDKFNLTEQQLDYVTKAESGCGLIIYDNIVIPFENRYPTDTKTFELMNTKPKEEVEDGG